MRWDPSKGKEEPPVMDFESLISRQTKNSSKKENAYHLKEVMGSGLFVTH